MANNATLRIYPVDFGAIFAKSGGLPLPQALAAAAGIPAAGTARAGATIWASRSNPAEIFSVQ